MTNAADWNWETERQGFSVDEKMRLSVWKSVIGFLLNSTFRASFQARIFPVPYEILMTSYFLIRIPSSFQSSDFWILMNSHKGSLLLCAHTSAIPSAERCLTETRAQRRTRVSQGKDEVDFWRFVVSCNFWNGRPAAEEQTNSVLFQD